MDSINPLQWAPAAKVVARAPNSEENPLFPNMPEDHFPTPNDSSNAFYSDIIDHLSNDLDTSTPDRNIDNPVKNLSFGPSTTHMVLMACVKSEEPQEGESGGVFTTALLKVLKADKDLTYAQIMEKIKVHHQFQRR